MDCSIPKHSLRQRFRKYFTSPITLDWELDNSSTLSPGSTIFGRLIVNVLAEEVDIDHFDAAITLRRTQKQPFRKGCANCKHHNTELHSWTFLSNPITLLRGKTEFPFSVLIPHDAPPSLETPILAITHEFHAKACISRVNSIPSTNNELPIVKFNRVFSVQASLSEPVLPQYLSQMVPRTNICATTTFDPVVYPLGPNHVSINFDGLMSFGGPDTNSQIWRLTQAAWSIEETVKAVPTSCTKHFTLRTDSDEPRNEIKTHVKRLGGKELSECWKSSDDDLTLQLDFDFEFKPSHKIHSRASYTSALESPGDAQVSHSLILELLFVLEHFPEGQPSQAIRTGRARTARLPYQILLVNSAEKCLDLCDESFSSCMDEYSAPPCYKEEF